MTFGILGNYANKGPCDSGFHIPTSSEISTMFTRLTNLGVVNYINTYTNYLLFPPAYFLDGNTGVISTSYGTHRLWTCSMSSYSDATAFYINENNIIYYGSNKPANGFNIRAFKDTSVTPDSSWTVMYQGTGDDGIFWNSTKGLISIVDGSNILTMQDHNVGATTVWQPGDTVDDTNAGLYYQFGNNYGFPHSGATEFYTTTQNVYGYGPEAPYISSRFVKVSSNNWFTSNSGVTNIRGGQQAGVKIHTEPKTITYKHLNGKEIWHNPTLGLVSITNDFGATWLTIADRDLGATTAGGQGSVFQWGNNYAFPATGTITTTGTRVDVSSYSTSNPYSSSSFYRNTNYFTTYPWWTTDSSSASAARNLWGQGTIYQGPCDSGFHIPSSTELTDLKTLLGNNSARRDDAYMVNNTYRTYRNATSYGGCWWSNQSYNNTSVYYLYGASASGGVTTVTPSNGFFIRPFYNQNVIPTTETGWTMTYQGITTRTMKAVYSQGNKVRPLNIPYEYQEVQYVESGGGAYIDTGFKPNNNTRYVIEYDRLNNIDGPIGCYNDPATYGMLINNGGPHYGTVAQNGLLTSLTHYTLDLNKNEFYIDGTLTHTFTAETFQMNINAWLGAWNRAGVVSNNGQVRIYRAKIYDNGTLVRDFVPCYIKNHPQHPAGFYDKITKRYYKSIGQSNFTPGPVLT